MIGWVLASAGWMFATIGAGLCGLLLASLALDMWVRWLGDPNPHRIYWKDMGQHGASVEAVSREVA